MTKDEILFRSILRSGPGPGAQPLDIAVLVMPRASILEVASILDPMRNANRQLGREAFRWRVVSPLGAPVPLTCGLELPSTGALSEVETADLLIIISGYGQAEVATPALISVLRRRSGRFGAIAGVDSGPWIMARAGLLAGLRATVHWEDLEDFAAAFPDIDVVPDRFVIAGNRITVGGAVPAADFMLHMISVRCGKTVAGQVADSFLYDTGADPARPQRPGLLPGVRDRRLSAALTLMSARLDDPMGIDAVAARVGISRRRLEQVFSQALGQSPGQAYLELRLQAARRMIVDTDHLLRDIAIRTGFPDGSSFSRAYKRRFGVSPKHQTLKVRQ